MAVSSGGGGPIFDVGAADGTGIDSDCPDVQVTVAPTIPNIMLLIDRSSSMNEPFGGSTRWTTLYNTLMDPDSGIVTQLQSTVRFGVALYTSQSGHAGGVCPMLAQSDIALDNYAAIDAIYAPAAPVDDTPTGDAIATITPILFQAGLGGRNVLLLATDGIPDTCAQPDPNNGHADALAAVQSAHGVGVETHILSVGPELTAAALQELANAGQGLPADGSGGDAPFYTALDPDQLLDGVMSIIGSVASCSFALDATVDLSLACDGTVLLDGTPQVCGIDWQLSDGTTLEFIGDACDTLRDGSPHEVEASWPCGAVEG